MPPLRGWEFVCSTSRIRQRILVAACPFGKL